ncbi:PAAR domain-containing protein [Acinetobacter haemolyticus]|uniref:PAAR domain-containing protein n=1 Tax=Acinetobacter haemolyticus TaxID=29430 RepID=UPI003F54BD43
MATPYIVLGCPTTGGGKVISGNSSFLIEGIAIACVGDKATCPKHQTVATIISGDPCMLVMGKAAARVNDALSCGCKLLPKQNLVVQDNAGGSAINTSPASSKLNTKESFLEKKDKEITALYWSYGSELTVLKDKSRFFNDLNLHVETRGYSDGEQVNITIESQETEIDAFELFTVSVKVNSNGKGIIKNVFKGRKILINTGY